MFILKILGRIAAIPVLILVGIMYVISKVSMTLVTMAHGLFWIFLVILAVFAVSNHMWMQLFELFICAVIGYILRILGTGTEVAIELIVKHLVNYICRG